MYRIQLEPEVDMILVRDQKNPDRTLIFFHYHGKPKDDMVHGGYVDTANIKPFLADVFKEWNCRHPVPETIKL